MSATIFDIFTPGTPVKTKIGEINGIITAATIRDLRIQYEVSYFYDGQYKNVWLDEYEFYPTGKSGKIVIGFK